MTKASMLRDLLHSKQLEFLMEGHNALSAKVAQNAGFRGIWASGLSIAASMGLSDRNEASWTQVLEVIELMVDNTSTPILMDGDSGFGDFNNVRRLVKKVSQRGVAGVCLEDKLFPKQNSFIGDGQPLASIQEFCGKIRAAKDSQLDPDFCVVARTETLVSGGSLMEALARAEHYRRAGADAILVHSKKAVADEVLAFAREWAARAPLVIVPTKYYRTPVEEFRVNHVSLVIWANHSLRASIAGMQAIAKRIFKTESIAAVEAEIASLDDVFGLTNEYEVQAAGKTYEAFNVAGARS